MVTEIPPTAPQLGLELCLTIFGLGLMSSLSDSKEIDVSNLVFCGWKRK